MTVKISDGGIRRSFVSLFYPTQDAVIVPPWGSPIGFYMTDTKGNIVSSQNQNEAG